MRFVRCLFGILVTMAALFASVRAQSHDYDDALDMRGDSDSLDDYMERDFTLSSASSDSPSLTAKAFEYDNGEDLALRSYIANALEEYLTQRSAEFIEDLIQRSFDLDRRAMDTIHIVSEDGSQRRTESTSFIISTWGSMKLKLRNWTRGREVHWVWQGKEQKDLYLLTESGVKAGDTITYRLGPPRPKAMPNAKGGKKVATVQRKKSPGRGKRVSPT